jgi:pimeloyl-ACP methyl ester carboxylesterase
MSTPPVQTVRANGLDLAYETFGDPADPAVVLVMGLGTQMVAWPDELCRAIAAAGHHVVRFDNRDVGASTHLHGVPPPSLKDLVLRTRPPYTIEDMADDTAGLIDALGLGRVHLVGASMGGFIAQTVALRHPDKVRSLVLMMTSTGSRLVGQPRARLFSRLVRRRVARDRFEAMDAAVEVFRIIGSEGYAFDEEHLRGVAGLSYDRGYDPAGYLRQLAATATQPNRTSQLRRISVPTLVVHGLHDPLVATSGGVALARAIPGARFLGFSGMGHDLPRELWDELGEQIVAVARRAP